MHSDPASPLFQGFASGERAFYRAVGTRCWGTVASAEQHRWVGGKEPGVWMHMDGAGPAPLWIPASLLRHVADLKPHETGDLPASPPPLAPPPRPDERGVLVDHPDDANYDGQVPQQDEGDGA